MARRLVVFVPAITGRTEAWTDLQKRLAELDGYSAADCDYRVVPHGGRSYKPGSVKDLAKAVGAHIHELWTTGDYGDVVLVGHSMGGLVLRQAYLDALGANGPTGRRPWAAKVDRIVLFASLNRGVDVSRHRAWWLPAAAWSARVLPVLRRWLVHDLLRGSDFITNLRISWIREINALDHPPLIRQFLGTEDNLVTDDDSSDVRAFPTGEEVPLAGATHNNLLQVDLAPDPETRFRLIAEAFTTPRPTAVIPEIGKPEKRVVILLHGIRAGNTTWVKDLKELLKAQDPDTEVVAATYGRFSARKFVLPITRRKYIGWLEDMYAEQLARNPKATFHFVGHSNGTYLLGHSLKRIPGMRFQRVLLTGSVLPPSYGWTERIDQGQVGWIRNDRASRDVPVAVLCAGLRGFRMRDIGTGGVDGFNDDPATKTEVYYHDGGHSAALEPQHLDGIAKYVLTGDTKPPSGLVRTPAWAVSLLSRMAAPLFLVLGAAAVSGLVCLALFGPWGLPLNLLAALVAVPIVLFFILDVV
ncbi:alpha/beta hydrolase [Yinghuangia soli]|uniref:Alpha/beta hydrolase n=1 Tax=Yinghuangia soli TaxID=2908204 RepID=A0AA41TYD4_9ACTN|nr:alpha/beta hydrolase [Yinghuangia soli]MCF2526276.1 alpha/beta hydrolase [Yinghuangia soli]